MTRTRRRVSQNRAAKSPAKSPQPSGAGSENSATNEQRLLKSSDDTCPLCEDQKITETRTAGKESWIQCDACKTWYHWRCTSDEHDLENVDKWFCRGCQELDSSRVVTMRPPTRKSSRKRNQLDYANLESGMDSDSSKWTRILANKPIKDASFPYMEGSEITIEWVNGDPAAMTEPVIVSRPEGLGMKMPSSDLTVQDIAEIVGEDTPIEVIDVPSQSNSPGWTLGKWAQYFNTPAKERDKIRNVISLEVSGTKLAEQILPPRLVREIDWVQKFWPANRLGKGHAYPKVQLYCLMGVATAWTDWHVDFAGSSVYYHVLCGSKVFYFIRPTPANLTAYEKWSGTELQVSTWLGDLVDEVTKVTLTAGNTMIIPTGWIHAVYTPMDSLVFGGNFLHSFNMATQLRIRNIEISTQVPKKFRFPLFTKLCWYAGEKYLRDLRSKEEFPLRILESIEYLASFLVSEARSIERGTESAKKDAKDQVPADKVKDASATARELRWRVKLAAGHLSDEEDAADKGGRVVYSQVNLPVSKRRRLDTVDGRERIFRNFRPKLWDNVAEKVEQQEPQTLKADRPGKEAEWTDWVAWDKTLSDQGQCEPVLVHRRTEEVVRVRSLGPDRLERQKVKRVVEDWVWSQGS